MSDFKKALGILSKAKQGSLFSKQPSKDKVGETQSGKPVYATKYWSADSFMKEHADWTHEDHHDASKLHNRISMVRMPGPSGSVSDPHPAIDTTQSVNDQDRQRDFHARLANLHWVARREKQGFLYSDRNTQEHVGKNPQWWDSVFRKAIGILEKALQGSLFGWRPPSENKVLGKTESGKDVHATHASTVQFYKRHPNWEPSNRAGWTKKDHRQADRLHQEAAEEHNREFSKLIGPKHYGTPKRTYHYNMSKHHYVLGTAHRRKADKRSWGTMGVGDAAYYYKLAHGRPVED